MKVLLSRWSAGRFALVLFVVAFLLRIGAVFALRDITAGPGREFGADGIEFDLFATRMSRGLGYTWSDGTATAFRAPGYPFFLAALYLLPGADHPAAYLGMALLGAGTTVITYLLGRELLSETPARLAAVFTAVYVPHIYFTTVFASENLFIPCLGGGVLLFLRYLKEARARLLFGAALLLGVATLTRPFAILLLPVLSVVLLVRRHDQALTGRLLATAVLTAGFALMVLPWTARNYGVFGRPVLVATNGGSTFYGANNDRVLTERHNLGGWVPTTILPGRNLIDAMPDEVSHDRKEWELGLAWVRGHVAVMPRLLVYKTVRLLLPDIKSGNRAYLALQLVGASPLLLLFLLGIGSFLKRGEWHEGWRVVHGVMAATLLMALIFWGDSRFRDANTPLLMLYASVGAYGLFRRRSLSATASANPPLSAAQPL